MAKPIPTPKPAEVPARPRLVAIDGLRLDGGTQRRESLDEAALTEYAARVEAGDVFPAVDAVEDADGNLWLWDGFHRYQAHVRAAMTSIMVRVTAGTLEDARWLSLSANKLHGVRRKPGEVAGVIREALALDANLSNRAIADHVGASESYVRTIRDGSTAHSAQLETRTGRDGKTRRMPQTEEIDDSTAHSAQLEPPDEPLLTDLSDSDWDALEDPAFDPAPLPDGEAPLDAEEIPFGVPGHARAGPTPYYPPEALPSDVPQDEAGNVLPEKLLAVFAQVEEFRALAKSVADLAREVKRVGQSPAGAQMMYQSVESHLGNARSGIWERRPYAVCPYCRAAKKHCNGCKGMGWVTKLTYNAAPPELRGES